MSSHVDVPKVKELIECTIASSEPGKVSFHVDVPQIYKRISEECKSDNCSGTLVNVAQKAGDLMHVEVDLKYMLEGLREDIQQATYVLASHASRDDALHPNHNIVNSRFYNHIIVDCPQSRLTVNATARRVFGL